MHSFDDNGTDGYDPSSSLIEVKGTLFGVSNFGGAYGDGTVYAVDPKTGAEAVFYSFSGSPGDGNRPLGRLLDVGNTLYGTTGEGGTAGCGTIFELDRVTGTETVLYNFQGSYDYDGAGPNGSLIDLNGILYGTAGDGRYGYGTIYSFDPVSKTEKVVYSFGYGEEGGDSPNSGLVAIHGILYGTTQSGGASNRGLVYSVDPKTGKETMLHSFQDNRGDGANPLERRAFN